LNIHPYRVHHGLAVYRFGSGRPVFFMPGPHRFQRPGLPIADAIIAGLMGLGRQVVTFDPPGSGHSTRKSTLGMDEMRNCTDEALHLCNVHLPVDAFGHSMGGLALLDYVLARPQAVRRLVLVGTGSGGPSYLSAPGALWNSSHPRFLTLAVLGVAQSVWRCRALESILNGFITRESFVDQGFAQPVHVAAADWFRRRRGRSDWHRIARRLDYSPRLAEVQAPTLILCGSHDPQFPPSASEQLHSGIAHSELAMFGRSGHYPFIEESDRFWATADAFLNRNVGRDLNA
jgi:proline iminopeptidase